MRKTIGYQPFNRSGKSMTMIETDATPKGFIILPIRTKRKKKKGTREGK
jgi:hypothetical protein